MDDCPAWFDALSDRYRFVREIGRGGMACVYLAEDLRYRRKVALKVLRDELAHALAHDRFLAEIQTAARLNHPNIVPLYDSGVIPAAGDRPALPWFTMMYIEGQTLKERLAGGPLPVADAVDITRAVAAALDYAHGERVIHRDIKPANILLAGDVPVVADFGIARALDRAGGVDTLTAPGLAVGTVQYISPEQAGAEATVDHRSDVYALGCVVYEMLAGHPPFTGPTPQSIIARHNLDPPPPLGTVRPTVPPGAVAAVEKALAKKPPDRWQSAGAFAHALRETTEHPVPTAPVPAWRRGWTRRRIVTAALAVAAVLAGAGYLIAGGGPPGPDVLPDTTRYVVFPFRYANDTLPRLGEDDLLRDALDRWDGVVVEDPFLVRQQLERGGRVTVPDAARSMRIAAGLGAGRYVHGNVARVGDSLRVFAWLYDVPTRHELRRGTVFVQAGLRNLEPALRSLADTLLLGGDAPGDGTGPTPGAAGAPGSASLPALQAFAAGTRGIAAWDLAAADSAYRAALDADGEFAQAALWLALVRTWSGRPSADWLWAARRAGDHAAGLAGRDSTLLEALMARAAGDMVAACSRWATLTASHERDFTGWYGLGDCLRTDRLVLPDPGSPTRWRFRTSYWSALRAFERAFGLLPSVHRALRSGGFSAVRDVFLTGATVSRGGVSTAGTQFAGIPSWRGDSLVVIPVRMEDLIAGGYARIVSAQSRAEATRNLRQEFLRIARGWVAAFPSSPEALEALANGMAMLGDPAAGDTLARARMLTPDPERALELAAQEVWLRLGSGLTGDLQAVGRAAALAESLQALGTLDRTSPGLAAGLAALTGRTGEVVGLIGRGGLEASADPPEFLRIAGPALWAYAALGGPADSVETYWARTAAAIEANLPQAERRPAREEWLLRAAAMAYPDVVPSGAGVLAGLGHVIPIAYLAMRRGDTAIARSALARFHRDPAERSTLAITPDVLPAEAALRWQVGDSAVAVGMLEASLADFGTMGPAQMSDPLHSAGAGRALLLWAAMNRLRGDRDGGFAELAGRLLWSRSATPALELIRTYVEVLR